MSSLIHPSSSRARDDGEETKEDLPADSNHDPNNNEGTSATKTTEIDHGTVAVDSTPQAVTATAAAAATTTTNNNQNNDGMKNVKKTNRNGPPPEAMMTTRPFSEKEEIRPAPLRLEGMEKYVLPKSKQPKKLKRGTRRKNEDKYPWGMFTTPEGIDLKSEEVKKKPLLVDWLGPVLRMEAETAWPRIPKNKEKMQQKEASSTTEEEQPNESADEQKNEIDSCNTDGKVAAKPKADENDEQNEGSEDDDDDDNDGGEDMPDGIADIDRMKAKVAPIFYEGRQFCNIIQAKQMADYVFGRWGVRLKLHSSFFIGCSYGYSKYEQGKHKGKKYESIDLTPAETPGGDGGDNNTTVANDGTTQNYVDGTVKKVLVATTKKRIRREARLQEVGCEFRIGLCPKYTGSAMKKNDVTRVENPVRITSCNMGHNHECSATTYDYAVHRAGLAGRPIGPNNVRPTIEPKRRVEPNVAAIMAAVESDDENNSAGVVDGSPRPTKKWKPIEQSTIPWGQYFERPHIVQILKNNSKLKPQDMNWMCPALIEEAEKAWPLPGDISPDLVSDHDRMHQKITTVFYPTRQFCNLFQAQQMAEYVLGRWGVRVKQTNGNALSCCYGHPALRTKRKWDAGVPLKRNKSNPAIAATFCPWFMNLTFRYPHHRGGKPTGIQRFENPVRITLLDMTHNHPCSAESLRAIKQSAGAYTQKLKRSTWKEIVALLNDDEEVDQNAVLRDILRPYFPDAVPISSSMIFNVKNKAKAMLEKGEVYSDDEGESTEGFPADTFPGPPSYQHLDMSVSLEDHFTYCKGFKNNVKTDDNPRGQLEWFCPPDSWLEQESRGVVARDDRSYTDTESGALVVFPTAEKSFWRKTHFRPALIKDDGAFLYANLKDICSYVVEASFSLVAANDSDEAGLMVRLDSEHWIKAGVQLSNGKVCLYSVVTNIFSDWCPYSVSWPFVFDSVYRVNSRRQEESQVVRSNCTLRIHCRGDDFVIEVQRDEEGDVWDVVRLANVSRSIIHKNSAAKTEAAAAAASETPENEGENSSSSMPAAPDEEHFWAGVFACCPHEQRGGHAIFSSFRIVQGSSYDADM